MTTTTVGRLDAAPTTNSAPIVAAQYVCWPQAVRSGW